MTGARETEAKKCGIALRLGCRAKVDTNWIGFLLSVRFRKGGCFGRCYALAACVVSLLTVVSPAVCYGRRARERKHISLSREVKRLSEKLASTSSFDGALSDDESNTCTDSTSEFSCILFICCCCLHRGENQHPTAPPLRCTKPSRTTIGLGELQMQNSRSFRWAGNMRCLSGVNFWPSPPLWSFYIKMPRIFWRVTANL